jgi:hypothetical protein
MSKKSKSRLNAGRLAIIIGVIAVSVILIVEGVNLKDIEEIIANGSILCLTCIGIG